MMKTRLKVGDRVRKKGCKLTDVVESLPGMREYDQYAFICADLGMILKDSDWHYQSDWQLVREPEEDPRLPAANEARARREGGGRSGFGGGRDRRSLNS